jgi:hypothetical protein
VAQIAGDKIFQKVVIHYGALPRAHQDGRKSVARGGILFIGMAEWSGWNLLIWRGFLDGIFRRTQLDGPCEASSGRMKSAVRRRDFYWVGPGVVQGEASGRVVAVGRCSVRRRRSEVDSFAITP